MRSARARRVERVAVSFDIDEPVVLLSLFIELPVVLLPVEAAPVVAEPLVPLRIELLPVEPVLVDEPGALPLERFVLLPVSVLLPVVPMLPACGPEVEVLLLGEPEAPPWPLVPVPVPPWAKAPPHASAAAAERARILKVCLMHDSCCVVGCLRQGRRVSTRAFGNGCAIGRS